MMLLQQYQFAQQQGQGINSFPMMNQPFNVPGYIPPQHPSGMPHMNGNMQQHQTIPQLPHFTQQIPHQNGHQQVIDPISAQTMHQTIPGHSQQGVPNPNTQQQSFQHTQQSRHQPQVSTVAPQLPLVQPQQLMHQNSQTQQQQFNHPPTPVQQVQQTSVQPNVSTPVNYQVPPFQPQTFIQPQPQQPHNFQSQISQTSLQQPSQNQQPVQPLVVQPQQHQQMSQTTSQPQNVVPPHSATPTVPPLSPQHLNSETPVQQSVEPQISQQTAVPPTPQNSQASLVTAVDSQSNSVAAVEPVMVAPLQQQQTPPVAIPSTPSENNANHASVTPQRSTISVQPYEPSSEVVEEQLVAIDDPTDEPEPPSIPPVNPTVESVPVICPVPIIPQQNQDNNQFIAPVQPQTQEQQQTET